MILYVVFVRRLELEQEKGSRVAVNMSLCHLRPDSQGFRSLSQLQVTAEECAAAGVFRRL